MSAYEAFMSPWTLLFMVICFAVLVCVSSYNRPRS